ncbi:MAG: Uma2 family endonuclease [Bacteroidetes bacterium]|nr:Uma2 family endonuclease [Bacteroidota bacterium]
MITKEKKYITPEEYLRLERESETKNEYYNGEICAMLGASLNHNILTTNILANLHNKLKNSKCIPFGSDMRMYVSENGLFTYPDVSVFCGDMKLYDDENDTALYPIVIFEVLSKATQDYDRGGKFKLYRDIKTLQDYVIVAQDSVSIEHYHKQPGNKWILEEFKHTSDELVLDSIIVSLKLSEIFDGVKV